MMKKIDPCQKALLQESWNAAKQSKSDLIIFDPKAYGGPHFAEKLGVPVTMVVRVQLAQPSGRPSQEPRPLTRRVLS